MTGGNRSSALGNFQRREFCLALVALLSSHETSRQPHAGEQDVLPQRKSLLTPTARRAIDTGLQYLATRQNDDGSIGTGGFSRNVAVVALCGMSFLAEGSTPGRAKFGATLTSCIDFVLANSSDSGLIDVPSYTARGPMYGHGFATMFLAESYGTAPQPLLREKLSRAVRLIVNTQNSEGGWRYEARRDDADLSVTVCQVMALRSAKNAGIFVPPETVERAVEFVKRCQNPDGGFTYMLNPRGDSRFPRSAAAIVALYSAGIYDSEEIRRGLSYLANVRSIDEQGYFMYGHYYAVQAMWHAGGDLWSKWYPSIRDWLIGHQRSDSSWQDPNAGPEFGTAMACLILQTPNNYLPIFQR